MAKRNRETLKNYFKQGKRPSEQEFEDLIDSTLNTLDDGFSGSTQIGLGLAPLSDDGVVISTYRNPGDSTPAWDIAVNKGNADLRIRRRDGELSDEILVFRHQSQLPTGSHELLMDGVVTSKGRKGNFKTGCIPADGFWHDILSPSDNLEDGCWAFEITAGCGERNKGRYALVVATAIHCFGSRPKIHTVQSFFGQWGNKIKFRWVKVKGTYGIRLQAKTHFRYGNETLIGFQITNLWDNPKMFNAAYYDVQKKG